MWFVLYLAAGAATTAAYAYRAGLRDEKVDPAWTEAVVAGVLWFGFLLVVLPYWAGRARAARLRDARVESALRAQEIARLEEDCRQEVARALVGR